MKYCLQGLTAFYVNYRNSCNIRCNHCTVNFVVHLVKSRLLELSLVLFSCSFLIIIIVCYLSFLPFVVNKDFQKMTVCIHSRFISVSRQTWKQNVQIHYRLPDEADNTLPRKSVIQGLLVTTDSDRYDCQHSVQLRALSHCVHNV